MNCRGKVTEAITCLFGTQTEERLDGQVNEGQGLNDVTGGLIDTYVPIDRGDSPDFLGNQARRHDQAQ